MYIPIQILKLSIGFWRSFFLFFFSLNFIQCWEDCCFCVAGWISPWLWKLQMFVYSTERWRAGWHFILEMHKGADSKELSIICRQFHSQTFPATQASLLKSELSFALYYRLTTTVKVSKWLRHLIDMVRDNLRECRLCYVCSPMPLFVYQLESQCLLQSTSCFINLVQKLFGKSIRSAHGSLYFFWLILIGGRVLRCRHRFGPVKSWC